METNKILYGIDLGTTNSAIARYENGEAVIKKNNLQKDTTPSCVAIMKSGKTLVGDKAYSQIPVDLQRAFNDKDYVTNSFSEFKRLMGTDEQYFSSNAAKSFTPEVLSSLVLQSLRANVRDDDVTSAIITVPAMFDNNQKDATKRAAKLAGFVNFELIQEPVAASIAYGLGKKNKDAYWLVFDIGGGTFDAALMHIEDGIIKPVDTAGDNKLGGKNIDGSIVDKVIIPFLKNNFVIDSICDDVERLSRFKKMWLQKAEEAKIYLSSELEWPISVDLGDKFIDNLSVDDEGNIFEDFEIPFMRKDIEEIARPIFQRAIDITKDLLKRNNLTGDMLDSLIFVGGPTYTPLLKKMVSEQITDKIDNSIDPMTVVARGAALYGTTVKINSTSSLKAEMDKIYLEIDVKSSTVQPVELAAVKFLKDKTVGYDNSFVFVEAVRSDEAFSTGKIKIDEIGDVLELQLLENKANEFKLYCYDEVGTRLQCDPASITIIQGIDIDSSAVMPMSLGIGVSDKDGIEIFEPIEGLEKNKPLPAKGFVRAKRTQKLIRAGAETDFIRISLYQLSDNFKSAPKAIYCNKQYDVMLTGDDIEKNLPEGSEINISFHADKSGTIDKFVVEIPFLNKDIDITERITATTKDDYTNSFIESEIERVRQELFDIDREDLGKEFDDIEQQYDSNSNDRDRKDATVNRLKAISIKVDEEKNSPEKTWAAAERRLRGIFNELEKDCAKYGGGEEKQKLEEFRGAVNQVIAKKNVEMSNILYHEIWQLDFQLAEVDFYIAWINDWDRNFERNCWSNKIRAHELIEKGLAAINRGSTANELKPIINQLFALLPKSERQKDILKK